MSPEMLTLVAAVEVYDLAREMRDESSRSLYAMSETREEKDIVFLAEGLGNSSWVILSVGPWADAQRWRVLAWSVRKFRRGMGTRGNSLQENGFVVRLRDLELPVG